PEAQRSELKHLRRVATLQVVHICETQMARSPCSRRPDLSEDGQTDPDADLRPPQMIGKAGASVITMKCSGPFQLKRALAEATQGLLMSRLEIIVTSGL